MRRRVCLCGNMLYMSILWFVDGGVRGLGTFSLTPAVFQFMLYLLVHIFYIGGA